MIRFEVKNSPCVARLFVERIARWRKSFSAVVVSLILCVSGVAPLTLSGAEGGWVWDGSALTIDSGRFTVVWRDGLMERAWLNGEAPIEFTREPTMKPAELPNGLGSFHEQDKAGRTQHHVHWRWNFKKLKGTPSFPAQHWPDSNTRVDFEEIQDGARLTYRGLRGDPSARLVQELTIDSATGDLIIRQRGSSERPGVFGIAFSLMNLRSDINFAVPYFGGQRFGPDRGKYMVGYAWPAFWSAGMVVGERPGGGSFVVFADDPKLGPKYLKIYNGDVAQALSFEACAQAPYDQRKSVEVCAWRFNAYRGNWVPAAKRYRKWLGDAYSLKPSDQRSPTWFHKISLIWPSGFNLPVMRAMSANLAPERILVVNYGWAQGFNENSPRYQPRDEDLAKTLVEARKMGYHCGVYVAEKLVDVKAHPELLEKLKLITAYDALSKKPAILDVIKENEFDEFYENIAQKAKERTRFLVSVHPGADSWIEFYSDLLLEYHRRYGIDCFYEDVAGAHSGSAGLVDGRGLHEGTVACERATRRKLPEVIAIGEHWNEVCVAAGMELCSGNYAAWFSRQHHLNMAKYAHPVQGCAFNDYSSFYNYKTPIRETDKFHTDYHFIEVTGMMPVWTTSPNDTKSEAGVTLARAKLYADGFRPYYPEDWEKGIVSYMRNSDGDLIKYSRVGESSFCHRFDADGGKELVYARLKGVSAYSSDKPVHIDGWPAYQGLSPIGLDPAKWYCLFPGKPEKSPVTITRLPPEMFIQDVRRLKDCCLVRLGGDAVGNVSWTPELQVFLNGDLTSSKSSARVEAPASLLFAFTSPSVAEIGVALPLEDWDLNVVANGMNYMTAKLRAPPRQWRLGEPLHRGGVVLPPRGGVGAEVSLDDFVKIPNQQNVSLSFNVGRFGGAGDGVNVIVRVNGEEIWRQFSPPKRRGWTPVVIPFTEYANKTILLSLAVDAGTKGFSTSNDDTIFSDPKFISRK